MIVDKLCRTDVVTIRENDDLESAAQLMREKHVGYLVVVTPRMGDGGMTPVGVLTDRDIVVKVIGKKVNPAALRVGDVMSQQPALARDHEDTRDALRTMRRIGVRRLPVVGREGQLVGVISLDDIMDALADDMSSVTGSIRREQRVEAAFVR